MAIDLNVTPYYNDFSAAKKFNRVVFKPGVAVQARELTQLQDYVLNTIKEFGDFVFKDGATVRGGAGYPVVSDYIKVNDLDASSVAVSNDSLANYVGDTLTGGTTGITAIIKGVKTGLDTDAVEKKTLYLNYQKGNETNAGSGEAGSIRFDAGETLTVTSTDSGRNGDTFVVDSNTSVNTYTKNFYGKCIDFTIEEGIIYAQGKFIAHDGQTIRLDPFNPNVNYYIGVKVNETIVTSDDDTSLLDPASGAYNYNAPGADRSKIDTEIFKVPFGKNYVLGTAYELGEMISNGDNIYEVTTAGTAAASGDGPVHTTGNATDGSVVFKYYEMPEGFTTLYKVTKGLIEKKYDSDIAELAELGKQLATEKRESDGDYVVEPFTLKIVEHLKTVKGVAFNTGTNTNYSVGQFVNHSGNLYEVMVAGTSAFGTPPVHTSGDVASGTVKFGYRGLSYRINNDGWHFSTDPVQAGDSDYVVALVSPGIAYANGYRREFFRNTPVKIRKGTSTEIKESRDVTMGYGNYFNINEVAGTFDIENGGIVNIGYYGSIGSQTAAAAVTDGTYGGHAALTVVIGTCRVRALKRASGNPGAAATEYRLYVYDIRINNGNLKDARSIQFPNSTDSGFADIKLEDVNGDGTKDTAVVHGAEYNKLIYNTPWSHTKTLQAGGSYDTAYYYTEEFNVSVSAAGTFTISTSGLGSEVIFPYTAGALTQTILDNKFYMVCKTSGVTDFGDGTTISGSEGRVIRLAPAQIIAAANGQSMEFNMGSPSGPYDAYLQIECKVVDAIPVPKALNIGRYVKLDTRDNAGGANGPWNLGIVDVQEITAVYIRDTASYNDWADHNSAENPVNYVDDFILDRGQTDNFYGHAKLLKKGSSSLNMTNKYVTVVLNHFDANYGGSNGTYFAKDSYPVDDTGATGIYTFELPVYKSAKLGQYPLRDAIDFRPRVKNTAVSATILSAATDNPYRTEEFDLPTNGIQFPTPNSAFTTDIEYYLPRVDKLVISKSGQMKIVEGVSKLPASAPPEQDAMLIARIEVPPFPSIAPNLAERFGADRDAIRHQLEGQTRRYKMSDIASIEKRINRLEYYLALSLMEMQAKDQVILDANGNDRFKNGIYVNAFDSDLLSDLKDPSYAASYNSSKKRLGPNFEDYQIDLKLNETHGTSGWTRSGSMIHRPIVKYNWQGSTAATKVRNCVGELQFNYWGEMDIYPRSDNGATYKKQMQKQVITLSNAAAIAAQVADVNASNNVVGMETTFELGVWDSENESMEIGATKTVVKENVTVETTSDAASTATNDNTPAQSTVTREGNMVTVTTPVDITGSISGEASFGQTIETMDVVTRSVPQIMTAQAVPADPQVHSMGNFVRDTTFLPNMRQNRVGIRVRRMKPNTRLWFYFDDELQWSRCTPCDPAAFDKIIPQWQASGARTGHAFLQARRSSIPIGGVEDASLNYYFSGTEPADMGDPIVTDENGDAAFVYWLPAGNDDGAGKNKFGRQTFPVGTRRMRVTDDPYDRENFTTTAAENIYSAFALQVHRQEIDLIYEQHSISYGSKPDPSAATYDHKGTVVTDSNLQPGQMTLTTNLEAKTETHFVVMNNGMTDPLAQTFGVMLKPNGGYAKKVMVWFRDRPGKQSNQTTLNDTGQGITCEIRKTLNGFPTSTVLAGGRKYLKNTEVNTTRDANDLSGLGFGRFINYAFEDQDATTFEFDEPIYLAPNEEYAIVLMPEANDPNYNVWCSKLGENKIGTKERVTAEETAMAGMLFSSANNRAWSPHQTEDLKYQIGFAEFEEGTGTVELVNEDQEFCTGSDYLNGRPEEGQDVHAFNVVIAGGGTGYSVDDIITLNAVNVTSNSNICAGSGVKLKVTSVSGGVVTGVSVVDAGIGFKLQRNPDNRQIVDPGTVGQLSVAPTGGSGATFTLKIKHGQMDDIDPRTEKLEIIYDDLTVEAAHTDSTRFFAVGDMVGTGDVLTIDSTQGQNKNTTFKIASIYNKPFNNYRTNTTIKEFPEGRITYQACTTSSSGASAAGSTFADILPVVRQFAPSEQAIYSASNEAAFTGSGRLAKKSFRTRFNISTEDKDLTPVVPLYRNAMITRNFLINNDSTGETGNNGNATSKFISRRVRLADGQEAEDCRLSVALKQPPGSQFKIYFKGQSPEDDGDFYEDIPWVEMQLIAGQTAGVSASNNSFVDFNFELPSTALDSDNVFKYTSKRVNALTIGTAGSGYASTSNVEIFFSGGGTPTRQAAVKCTTLSGGGLGTLEIVDPGRGYATAPTVTVAQSHEVSKYYAAGTFVGHLTKLYECTVGGTTGAASAASAPTHGSGTATDGTVTWTYRGVRPAVTCTVADTDFKRFKYFSTKMVMLSTNSSNIPEAKQLRVIALQA